VKLTSTSATHQFEVKGMQDFSKCCVPADLHATDGNKVMMFWCTKFVNKVSDLIVFDFRLENIYNNSMYLRVSFKLTAWQCSWEFLYKAIEFL